jgi:hypothetical protein
MPFAIHFTLHTWIVIESTESIDRFDVFGFRKDGDWERDENLYQNYHEAEFGCPVFAVGARPLFHNTFRWNAVLLYEFSSEAYPRIVELHRILTDEHTRFPYLGKYRMLPGPNSNTFVQWAVNYATGESWSLPWGAWGKGYGKSGFEKAKQ